MSTKKELLARWESEPGRTIRQEILDLCPFMWAPDHTITSEEISKLLDRLPFRDEVSGGRDLRGLGLGFIRKVNFGSWDFSYGNPYNLVNCDLTTANFSYSSVGGGVGTLSGTLDKACFFNASVQKCCLDGSPARGCNFEKARLKKCDLRNVNFTGSCFRNAKFKDCSFSGADIRGCDFRGATLDEVMLYGVCWDKTTDLRGATLLNVFDEGYKGKQGVVPGADWHQANFDDTTRYIRDPLPEALKTIGACIAAAGEMDDDLRAKKIGKLLRETRDQIKKKFNPTWSEDLQQQLTEEEKECLEEIFGIAVEYLK